MSLIPKNYIVGESESLDQKFNRRKFIKLGAFAVAGLAASSTFLRKRQAGAVAPGLIYATLLGVTAAPIVKNAWEHFAGGEVKTVNEESQPVKGSVQVIVLDAVDERFDVSGYFGSFYIPPGQTVFLPYGGLVPNGSGQKIVYARSIINESPYYRFDWPYS